MSATPLPDPTAQPSPLVDNPRILAALALMRQNMGQTQAATPDATPADPRPLPPQAQQYLQQTQANAGPVNELGAPLPPAPQQAPTPQLPPQLAGGLQQSLSQPSAPSSGPSGEGVKGFLTKLLYGAGQAVNTKLGIPTDYEKAQNAAHLQIAQQAANDNSQYRQALTDTVQNKAAEYDRQRQPFVIPNDRDTYGALAGVPTTVGNFEALSKVGFKNFGAKQVADARANSAETIAGDKNANAQTIAAEQIAGRQRAAETGAAARVKAAELTGGNRTVQVIDPNNPQRTIQMSPRQANEMGAGGTQSLDYQAQRGVLKDFTAGADSHTLNAINTARGHVDQGLQAIGALDNNNVQAFNKIAQFYNVQTGQPAPVEFNAIKNALAGEISKSLTGAGATVSEIANVGSDFSNASSPAQLRGVLTAYGHLLDSKQNSLKQQFDQGMQAKPNFNPQGSAPASTKGGMAEKYGGVTIR
jgi:hypothetical protein